MRELAAVLLAYASVAAAVAAGSPPSATSWMPRRARAILAVLAVAAVAAAAAQWPRSDGPILAGVCIVMAMSAMASVFILIAPVWPRIAWTLAAVVPLAVAILAAAS